MNLFYPIRQILEGLLDQENHSISYSHSPNCLQATQEIVKIAEFYKWPISLIQMVCRCHRNCSSFFCHKRAVSVAHAGDYP